jgi:membrane protein CcdC involved in cytochrome C biogenesis
MESTWQIAIHTPWWVYALFAYLIFVGFKASRTRTVSIKKIFIIPIIFAAMSVHTLMTSFQLDAMTIMVWSAAIFIGMVLGWIQVYQYHLEIDKKNHRIQVPGTWTTLLLILIIFAAKYYFGYELAIDPTLIEQTSFEYSMLGVSGVCTGLFVGRLFCYLYRIYQS